MGNYPRNVQDPTLIRATINENGITKINHTPFIVQAKRVVGTFRMAKIVFSLKL
jgi:hypothetical protein